MSKQGRVLVVDDKEYWREALVKILEDNGFYAIATSSARRALEQMKETLYHVLVLDARLNDADSSNWGGIDLLSDLEKRGLIEAMKIIMISAYGDKEQTRKVFREFEVADFIFKDNFNEKEFLETVRRAFAEEMKINLALDIRWQQLSGPEQAVLNLEVDGTRVKRNTPLQSKVASEFEDLLCRLFYQAKSVIVRPLAGGYSGSGVLLVQPFYTTGGGGYEVVVKFGNFREIAMEYFNFKVYVQPFLGGGRNTTALDMRRTPRLGGIIYSLLGTINDQLVDLGDFYRRADIFQIRDVLLRLFQDSCRVWYANRSSLEPVNITADYQHLFKYIPDGLEQIVAEQLQSVQVDHRLTFERLGNKRSFTNPWLAAQGKSLERSSYRCITHGDFNQRNLLVDSNRQVWMIDFQGTGPGHILRDVATLDSTVRFQLLAPREATLRERLRMEEALCSIEHFGQLEQLEISFSTRNPALTKCFDTVIHLRKLARWLVEQNLDDISEYFIALFYTALNTIRFSSLKPIQREHAILCASLLADKLKLADSGDTSWIPTAVD